MAKVENKAIQAAVGFSDSVLAVPQNADYAKSNGDSGMSGAERYASMPRIKIVQGSSNKELKKLFSQGTVLLTPDNLVIANAPSGAGEKGEPFVVIPLAFVTTYERRAVYGGDSQLFILEATRDDRSDLAMKCRNPKARDIIGPTGEVVERCFEVINVVCTIDSGPCTGQFGILSFASMATRDGRKFIDRVSRLRAGYKCYLQRVALRVSDREGKKKNSWLGLDVGDPTDGVIVGNERVDKLTADAESACTMIASGALDRAPVTSAPVNNDDIPI